MKPVQDQILLGWPTYSSRSRVSRTPPQSIRQRFRDDSENLNYSIKYDGDGHLVTIAPTGSGKGVGLIIPNLLNYSGSAIVVDPKGENFVTTARYRKDNGNEIVLLDPFEYVDKDIIDGLGVERARLNPLDICKMGTESIENASQMIANVLSGTKDSFDNDPFWDIVGRTLVSGLIYHEMMVSNRDSRPASFEKIIDVMFGDDPIYSICVKLDTEAPGKFARRTLGGLVSREEKVRDSILVTAQSYLTLMANKDISKYFENSTFKLHSLQSNKIYTIYIVIPPNKLQSHGVLLGLWVSVLLNAVMGRKTVPDKRTLFILDECANLGELDDLRKAVTLLRGYGLQVWMFFQDLSQMEYLYPADFRTMINNCGVVQAFGISRRSAAYPLARIIGTYKPAYISKLDRSQQILSLSDTGVKICRLMRYYRDEAFEGRYDVNPLISVDEALSQVKYVYGRSARF